MHLGLKNGHSVPHNLLPVQGIPVPLLKFRWPPDLDSLSVLLVEEKGCQMYMYMPERSQNFELTQNVG